MTDTVTVQLSKPITHEGKTITELVFNEATVGDACLADSVKGETSKILAILSGMSGQPMPLLMKLSFPDFNKVVDATVPLMGELQQQSDGSMP